MSDTTQLAAPTQDAAAHDAAAGTAIDARNKLVISLLLVSTFVVILNETIMGVALPKLILAFHIDASAAQWLSAGFMLTMAVVIPITGFLLQRFNTRPLFIAAMTFFSLGTLIAAIAPGFEVLLVARIVQACGTAIMFPLLLTTVMTLVAPASRGRTMGNISIVISVAPAIGPTISGVILSILDWRFMFILVLPIAVAALIVGAVRMKNVTTPSRTHFDVFSVILSAFGFGGLVYGLSNLGAATPDTIVVEAFVPLAVGVVALIVFVLRQIALERVDSALLDLRTFASRTFTFSIIMFTVSMMAFFGTIIVLPIYMQTVLGIQPLSTGLLLLPGGLIMGLLSPVIGRIYDRSGPTALLVTGAVITSGVLWGMTMLTAESSFWWVLAAHVSLSIGLALLFTPLFTASLASLKPSLYSHGSAIVGTIQQVAGAAGTALLVTVLTAEKTHALAQGASTVEATATGIHSAFLYAAIISLLAIPAAFFVRRTIDAPTGGDAPPAH
ncbi:MAG: transporter [Glaciihabitans sp.]|jgi:DHA2 family lincomycin resistance protein-like MFS transporter|nr:transporter [Glaciihabitans sp.]MDQ1569908.1 transporter, family, lincomycin resistance protein [Actinomycetota bacterium]